MDQRLHKCYSMNTKFSSCTFRLSKGWLRSVRVSRCLLDVLGNGFEALQLKNKCTLDQCVWIGSVHVPTSYFGFCNLYYHTWLISPVCTNEDCLFY